MVEAYSYGGSSPGEIVINAGVETGTGYFIYDLKTNRVIRKIVSLGPFITVFWGMLDSCNNFVFWDDDDIPIEYESKQLLRDMVKPADVDRVPTLDATAYTEEEKKEWIFVRATYVGEKWDIDWTDSVMLGDV